MPLIIGEGLGRDDQIIIQRIIGDQIVATVQVKDSVLGVASVDDAIPSGTVSAPLSIFGMVSAIDQLQGMVTIAQNIIGVVKEEGPLMSVASNRVTTFLRDDRTLEVSANYEHDGSVVDLTGAKIWFTVKDRTSDEDSEAHIMKRNTAAGGSDSEILVTNPTGGALEVYLVPADSTDMNPGTYQYDVQVILANGKTYTIVRSQITFKEDVTRAAS